MSEKRTENERKIASAPERGFLLQSFTGAKGLGGGRPFAHSTQRCWEIFTIGKKKPAAGKKGFKKVIVPKWQKKEHQEIVLAKGIRSLGQEEAATANDLEKKGSNRRKIFQKNRVDDGCQAVKEIESLAAKIKSRELRGRLTPGGEGLKKTAGRRLQNNGAT